MGFGDLGFGNRMCEGHLQRVWYASEKSPKVHARQRITVDSCKRAIEEIPARIDSFSDSSPASAALCDKSISFTVVNSVNNHRSGVKCFRKYPKSSSG